MSEPTTREVAGGSDTVLAALKYASLGWAVLPLHTPSASGCSRSKERRCLRPGKHPRLCHSINDVARLRGARLVTAVEAEGERRLAEAAERNIEPGGLPA
jgi:hypothetical protein